MSEEFSNLPPGDESQKKPDPGLIAGQVRHRQISARVPETVSRGVFSTGAIVLVGANEFIIDFLLRMARPHQIVARVVLPHAVMLQVITTLRANLTKYQNRFGEPPAMPAPPADAPKPSIQEIYDDLKMPDPLLPGAYANAVMVSHSPSEFCFDFITNFFPQSCVSARIYISAPQVPRLLEAFTNTFNEFQKRITKLRQTQPQPPEAKSPAPPESPESPESPSDPDKADGPS